MTVILDTCVLSLALRRSPKSLSQKQKSIVFKMKDLVKDGNALLLNCVRQEVLTGFPQKAQFETTRSYLRYFRVGQISATTAENAAEISNLCRSKGIKIGSIDALIVAASIEFNATLFSTDKDFVAIRKVKKFDLMAE
ncbi:MAG: PIN domain-containing protein [Planctomycetes bacterium]|nr:PIN domain-containing protein [Planctomycetota bacterium]